MEQSHPCPQNHSVITTHAECEKTRGIEIPPRPTRQPLSESASQKKPEPKKDGTKKRNS